jgi:hypothetical protein
MDSASAHGKDPFERTIREGLRRWARRQMPVGDSRTQLLRRARMEEARRQLRLARWRLPAVESGDAWPAHDLIAMLSLSLGRPTDFDLLSIRWMS